MSTVTKTCQSCGAKRDVEIPDSLTGSWRKMLERFDVLCEMCEQREELERAAHERELAERQAEREFAARAKRCGIPTMLRGLPWDDIEQQGRGGALDAARRWADGSLRGLLLTGTVGVGKTHLAAIAAWDYLHRAPLTWVSIPSLMAALGQGFSDQRRKNALALVEGTGALVLDDLDKCRPSAFAAEQLFGAIDSRVTAGASLIVTTNLDLNAIAARYPDEFGEALASRLAGYCETRGMVGSDRRFRRAVAA